MTKCVFCPELGVATTATTTLNEAFPFLCTQLGLLTSFGGGRNGGDAPPALCSSCHNLWEEVSVLYSNMQGLLNLMARRVTQFKKNIDKGHGHGDEGRGPRTRGRKRNPPAPPPPDEESMLSWWYPSASDCKRNKRDEVGTEKGVDVEPIQSSQFEGVDVGCEEDIKKEQTDMVEEEIDLGKDHGSGDQEIAVEFDDYEIFPEHGESEDEGGNDTKGDPSYHPLQSTSPSHSLPADDVRMTETLPLDFGVTQKNKPSLFYNNLSYVLYKKKPPPCLREYWKCKSTKCSGRLIKINGKNSRITLSKEHTCSRSPLETEIDKMRQDLKSTAIENPTMAPSDVVATIKAKYSVEAIQCLPSNLVLYRNIRYSRAPRKLKAAKTLPREKKNV